MTTLDDIGSLLLSLVPETVVVHFANSLLRDIDQDTHYREHLRVYRVCFYPDLRLIRVSVNQDRTNLMEPYFEVVIPLRLVIDHI
jgi:hypothetical protein